MTAANRFGLYSAFLHLNAMSFKFNSQFKLAVETKFCNFGRLNSATFITFYFAIFPVIPLPPAPPPAGAAATSAATWASIGAAVVALLAAAVWRAGGGIPGCSGGGPLDGLVYVECLIIYYGGTLLMLCGA